MARNVTGRLSPSSFVMWVYRTTYPVGLDGEDGGE